MSARDKFIQSITNGIRPDPKVWIDQWAEDERVLPPDTPEPGPWRNARTPYLIDIMRTMSPGSAYREGWCMKGHQLGGSSAGENFIGGSICTAAGSMLVVFPTLDDAKQWELTRFEEMRKSTKALRHRVRDSADKGADNTKLRKKYPGGVMRLVGANRVGALKSSTIRYVKFEEPDEYPPAIGDQGDTITLAIKRTSNFGRKAKIYGDGTPTIDERSAIQKQYKRGDQREWRLFCPGGCGEAQPLVWSQFKWDDGDAASTRFQCRGCNKLFSEHQWKSKNYADRPKGCTEEQARDLGLAHWVGTAQGERYVASWKLPSFIAPIGWRPWVKLVEDWLAAQGDEEALKTWWNNEAGECWKDTVRSVVGAEVLQQRAENYDLMTVPAGGLVLVAGVDTQDNRLAVVVRAYGRGEESWGIWHSEIYGDPSTPEVWAKLRELLDAPFKHASGQVMRIDAAAIDAGGHHGEDVYAFCRDAQVRGKHWFAIRGAKAYDAPKLGRPKTIEFNWRGRAVPGGAMLRFVGTQSIKNLIDGRFKLEKPGGGYYHNPLGFQTDYFRQVRSERREWRKDGRGNKALWWVKGSERNEAWDCEVYCYAAFLYLMSGRHAETVFRNREKLFLSSLQMDILDIPAEVTVVETHSSGALVDSGTGEILAEAPSADVYTPPAAPVESITATEQEQLRAPVPSQPIQKPAKKTAKPKRPGSGFVKRWGNY